MRRKIDKVKKHSISEINSEWINEFGCMKDYLTNNERIDEFK